MITQWIEDAGRALNIALSRLDDRTIENLIAKIRTQFTESTTTGDYLWEDFVGDFSRRSADGWRTACSYEVEFPIVVFQDGTDYAGYRIKTSECLRQILAETPGFEFYLTNDSVDFVLCFNHHDFLIGVGVCKEWLISLPQ